MTAESGLWSHGICVTVGAAKLVFISGQTARHADGRPLPDDDFEAQFERVYESLELVLHEAGASFDDVVSMRTFVTRRTDIETYSRLRNAAHDILFPDQNYPTNTLVVVEGLADRQMLLEVEAIAVVPA